MDESEKDALLGALRAIRRRVDALIIKMERDVEEERDLKRQAEEFLESVEEDTSEDWS